MSQDTTGVLDRVAPMRYCVLLGMAGDRGYQMHPAMDPREAAELYMKLRESYTDAAVFIAQLVVPSIELKFAGYPGGAGVTDLPGYPFDSQGHWLRRG